MQLDFPNWHDPVGDLGGPVVIQPNPPAYTRDNPPTYTLGYYTRCNVKNRMYTVEMQLDMRIDNYTQVIM